MTRPTRPIALCCAMLTAAGCLIAVDEAVAASDAVLIQDQIAVFKALGGGWRSSAHASP